MTYIYTIASLNINGIANDTRIRILENFFWSDDSDIAMLQEVTGSQLDSICRYTKQVNIGTERRRTAILARDGLILTDVSCLPSGRGIVAMYNGTRLINIYAPLHAERKQEREWFYNVDVPYLHPATEADIIISGVFNCVLSHTDATDHGNNSRALENLVTGLGLSDVGEMASSRPMFIHYTSTRSSSLHRTYISPTLRR